MERGTIYTVARCLWCLSYQIPVLNLIGFAVFLGPSRRIASSFESFSDDIPVGSASDFPIIIRIVVAENVKGQTFHCLYLTRIEWYVNKILLASPCMVCNLSQVTKLNGNTWSKKRAIAIQSSMRAAGRKGGLARKKALSPKERVDIARNAINARWQRVRDSKLARGFGSG